MENQQQFEDVYPKEEVAAIAQECSETERRAADAERELIEWKKIKFMADRVGEDFDGMILSVTKYGMFVELSEMYVEGLVPIFSLTDDHYTYRETTREIRGGKSNKVYRPRHESARSAGPDRPRQSSPAVWPCCRTAGRKVPRLQALGPSSGARARPLNARERTAERLPRELKEQRAPRVRRSAAGTSRGAPVVSGLAVREVWSRRQHAAQEEQQEARCRKQEQGQEAVASDGMSRASNVQMAALEAAERYVRKSHQRFPYRHRCSARRHWRRWWQGARHHRAWLLHHRIRRSNRARVSMMPGLIAVFVLIFAINRARAAILQRRLHCFLPSRTSWAGEISPIIHMYLRAFGPGLYLTRRSPPASA